MDGLVIKKSRTTRRGELKRVYLGEDYEEIITTILPPPEPPRDIKAYTSERVKTSLRYADATLRNMKRKISPAGETALKLYESTCIELLELLDDEEGMLCEDIQGKAACQLEYQTLLSEMENSFQYNLCMRLTHSESAAELQQEILNLQRNSFYARYGDYFAELCSALKVTAERSKLPGWQKLSKTYWTEICERVKKETEIYERFQKGEEGLHGQMPTIYAIHSACLHLGLNPDETMHIINQYGIRNNLCHANLLPLIKHMSFKSLGERLWKDRCDIPLIFSESDSGRRVLEKLLDSIIDLWFTKDEIDPTNPEGWNATPELRAKCQALRAGSTTESEAQINKEISKEISKNYKSNLRASTKEHEASRVLKDITGEGRPPGRVASKDYKQEREAFIKKKKSFDAIMNLSQELRSLMDAYTLNGKEEFRAPEEVVEDNS
ncbi:hypothetical protein GLAREA_01162 [Glarea lozoyensis ATCC 20868]|uniref:Uncharacterized protein n=1 Tax=Glarea lozoyensis (strain ATCC 20868 / MF5171) TaxID=1116229 RepID=S3CUB4_GLAL2|nr:uncharacterized protein GLAREA_01162 [Glarea lozoyensis ATCC 20868]EPE30002.1 hypothetical protein GLAREA_01162 [Glarea lozoyensis ATCC 20868]